MSLIHDPYYYYYYYHYYYCGNLLDRSHNIFWLPERRFVMIVESCNVFLEMFMWPLIIPGDLTIKNSVIFVILDIVMFSLPWQLFPYTISQHFQIWRFCFKYPTKILFKEISFYVRLQDLYFPFQFSKCLLSTLFSYIDVSLSLVSDDYRYHNSR